VQQGRRPAALRQYQACVAALQKELGVEPEPETRRLYLEILQRDTRALGAGRPASTAASRVALPTSDAPLVGRADELSRLRQRLRAAWRGRGQMVLITGEPGIGKTRLVEELGAVASTQGARVLVGRGHETEQILPFRPWIDALRSGRALDAAGAASDRTELARLFPELAAPETHPSMTMEGRVRLFESVDALIAALAVQQPLLIVLEDLQWADDMTLRLLAFVVRRLGERPVLLVGTAREEELSETLASFVAELRAVSNVEPMPLGGLSESATAALVRALARAGSNDARLAEITGRVWALSEGNPFVIVETMRTLRESHVPDAGSVELPQRVRTMIAGRIDRLSPAARELARVASVFSRDFEFSVLQRAAGLGPRETAEAVEELVRRRILDAVGERFDFTHARLRQAVYGALLAPRRQALHAAIGEAIETVYAGRLDEWYDRLAWHFSHADDAAKAFSYLVHFADKAARRYALDETVRALKTALTFADRLPPPERARRRLDVVHRLAHRLSMLGRPAEARDLLLAEESLIAQLHDPSLSGVYHFWLAYASSNLADSARAHEYARRALEEAARGGDEITMGRASFELSRESYIVGRPLEGIAQGRQAVALLERTNDHWWLGQALCILALNLLHIGDFAPALEAMEQARTLGETAGDVQLQAEAAGMTARIYAVMGEGEAAIAAGERGVPLAPDLVTRMRMLGWLAAAYHENGEAARAIRLFEEALELVGSTAYRARQVDGFLMALLSDALRVDGQIDRAAELAGRALAVSTAGAWFVAVGYAYRARGRIALASGKLEDAEVAQRQSLETFEKIDARCQVARARLDLAEVLGARGDRDGARVELETARDVFMRMQAPRLVERASRQLAALGFARN
jgi:tetratricopeptide (TPR) repeat protein/energy-coupling factor transporter ATP-binding protein EcfA2